jgi:hypothetical protein
MNYEYKQETDEIIVDFGIGTRRVECYVNENRLYELSAKYADALKTIADMQSKFKAVSDENIDEAMNSEGKA